MREAIERFKDDLTRASGPPQTLLRVALVVGNQPNVAESREHVLGVCAFDAAEVEVGRVEFGAEKGALGVFPNVDTIAA